MSAGTVSSSLLRKETRKLLEVGAITQEINTTAVPDVWTREKDCLLILYQCRMLLREMVEYRHNLIKLQRGDIPPTEIRRLLELNDWGDADRDLLAEIEELKRQMIKQIRSNSQAEREYKRLDKKIQLVISNTAILTSIKKPEKKKQRPGEEGQKVDSIKPNLKFYAQLFYLLQTEPQYLGQLAVLLTKEEMEAFQDTLILTIFGNAYAPREEFLILELFRHATEYEMKTLKSISGFTSSDDSALTKMVMSYNRRKQGVSYLTKTFGGIMTATLGNMELDFEMKHHAVYNKIVSDMEVNTGVKQERLPADKVKDDPEVKKVLEKHRKDLEGICKRFLKTITRSLKDMPYGLRYICKQVKAKALQKWPQTSEEKIFKAIGYLVYYRFLNLVIVTPEQFDIGNRDIQLNVRKNLIWISKVLQKVFDLSKFPKDNELAPMNHWIEKTQPQITQFFRDLINVADPESFLQVDKYKELTIKSTPVILISYSEIANTHTLLEKHRSALTKKNKKDPLEEILSQFKSVPSQHLHDEQEVQLDLDNRFAEKVADEIKPEDLHDQTVELVIQLFRKLTMENLKHDNLAMILVSAGKVDNKQVKVLVKKIQSNLDKLAKGKLVDAKSGYRKFLRAVALDVANRGERRDIQLKEIARLKAILKTLKKHGEYLEQQTNEFKSYLKALKKTAFEKHQKKQRGFRRLFKSKDTHKFTYKELAKMGVIVRSDVPTISRGKTRFFITQPEPGEFMVEAKIAGLSVGKVDVDMEDLFLKKENGITELELEQVTLDVNMTIHLINREFLGAGKKK